MKKMREFAVIALVMLVTGGSLSAGPFDFKEKAKRKGCEKSCEAVANKAVDSCTEKMGKKPEKKDDVDPKCKAAGEAAQRPCVNECMSK